MMNQQLDKLFREKLQGYQKPAPVNAWDKVERGLLKKNSGRFTTWLRAAAAVLLIATTLFLLWPVNDNTLIQPLAEQTKTDKTINAKKSIVATKDDIGRNIHESLAAEHHKTATSQHEIRHNRNQPALALVSPVFQTPTAQEAPGKDSVNKTPAAMVKDEFNKEVVAEVLTPERKSTTIIFTAAEVNEKYLDKSALAEATSPEKKPSRLKKLLNKAHTLKNNQDPFGELRQRKNEILALNFTKDKRNKTNH